MRSDETDKNIRKQFLQHERFLTPAAIHQEQNMLHKKASELVEHFATLCPEPHPESVANKSRFYVHLAIFIFFLFLSV